MNPYGGVTSQDECPLSSLKPTSIKNFDPSGNAPDGGKGLVDKRAEKSFTKDLKKLNQLLAPYEANMLDGGKVTVKEDIASPDMARQITFACDDAPEPER